MSAEEKAREKRKELERREARRRREDLRAVMGTATGRRFMWRLLNADTGISARSYTGELGSTAFNEGRRSVGLVLLEELQRDAPEAWARMMSERAEQIQTDLRAQKRPLPSEPKAGEPDAHDPFHGLETDDE